MEWAEYAGNLYGTAKSTLAAAEEAGHDLLFDVEVVGAANLKRACPDAVSCFLLPPCWARWAAPAGPWHRDGGTFGRRLATGRREPGQEPTPSTTWCSTTPWPRRWTTWTRSTGRRASTPSSGCLLAQVRAEAEAG
ncbi:MAG: hypothetical protein R3F60_12690 [bacterium]